MTGSHTFKYKSYTYERYREIEEYFANKDETKNEISKLKNENAKLKEEITTLHNKLNNHKINASALSEIPTLDKN